MPGISSGAKRVQNDSINGIHLGDKVFVKPPSVKCTSSWPVGTVTDLPSDRQVEVNGIPRHVSDVRLAIPEDASPPEDAATEDHLRPSRERRRPDFYGNNIYDF